MLSKVLSKFLPTKKFACYSTGTRGTQGRFERTPQSTLQEDRLVRQDIEFLRQDIKLLRQDIKDDRVYLEQHLEKQFEYKLASSLDWHLIKVVAAVPISIGLLSFVFSSLSGFRPVHYVGLLQMNDDGKLSKLKSG